MSEQDKLVGYSIDYFTCFACWITWKEQSWK